MIRERLRPIFAKERRPLLLGHLALALALVPIPMIRTGWVEVALVFTVFPFRMPASTGPLLLLIGLVISSPLMPLFLAWSLPDAARTGLPKRSIGVLCLLIAYQPFRYYWDGIFFSPENLAMVAEIHERTPAVWVIKHLDALMLAGIAVWAIVRRETASAGERMWFHWLLFVCAIWAICGFADFAFGFFIATLLT